LDPTEAEPELNDAGVDGTKTNAAAAIGARWEAVLSFAVVWFW
jgi:hypothetical protein